MGSYDISQLQDIYFSLTKQPQYLATSYKTDLDFQDCFVKGKTYYGRENPVFYLYKYDTTRGMANSAQPSQIAVLQSDQVLHGLLGLFCLNILGIL